jgi:beta-lactamase class A
MTRSILLVAIILGGYAAQTLAQHKALRAAIQRVVAQAPGRVGVAVRWADDTLTVDGKGRFPMQSVYKFPLALAVLDQVDRGVLRLNQEILVRKEDLLPDTWSPLREKYPEGNVKITLSELLTYTVSQSDNNGCDILFRLLGGVETVERYIQGLGVEDISIATTEAEMHRDSKAQYRNSSSPLAMAQLLWLFDRGKILSAESRDFLWDAMVKTVTGPRSIKGLLPPGTVVAHKTGSSRRNPEGVITATNDVGILTLPDGGHLILVVFVSDARSEESRCEESIAKIAKAVWDASTDQ